VFVEDGTDKKKEKRSNSSINESQPLIPRTTLYFYFSLGAYGTIYTLFMCLHFPRQKNSQSEWTRIFYCAALPLPKEIKAA